MKYLPKFKVGDCVALMCDGRYDDIGTIIEIDTLEGEYRIFWHMYKKSLVDNFDYAERNFISYRERKTKR